MKFEDVFGHELQGGWPVLRAIVPCAVAEGGPVVKEGINPDIDDLIGVPWHRNTPRDLRPGDGEVLQAEFNHLARFVEARLGNNPSWMGIKVRK